jgi:choline kinase
MKKIALVYLAAGISSRFGGKIKQFADIGGKTLIDFSLDQALKTPFSEIIFIVGEKTEAPFREKFGNFYKGIPVSYAMQKYNPEERDKPWGTVDAVCTIKTDIPFVLCNSDDIYGEDSFRVIFEHLQKNEDNVTVGYVLEKVLPESGSVNRGIFKELRGSVLKIEENYNISRGNLQGLSSKDLCSMNIFGLQPQVLNLLSEILREFKENNKGNRTIECLLSNEMSKLIESGKIKMKIYKTDAEWMGVTNPGDEELIKKALRSNKM